MLPICLPSLVEFLTIASSTKRRKQFSLNMVDELLNSVGEDAGLCTHRDVVLKLRSLLQDSHRNRMCVFHEISIVIAACASRQPLEHLSPLTHKIYLRRINCPSHGCLLTPCPELHRALCAIDGFLALSVPLLYSFFPPIATWIKVRSMVGLLL